MLTFDSFAVASIVAYLALALTTVACAPRRDLDPRGRRSLLLVGGGTVLAYAAGSLPVFLAGWLVAAVPYWLGWEGDRKAPRVVLALSSLALGVGTLLVMVPGRTAWRTVGFGAIVAAALMRKGIFPFHFWVTSAFREGSPPVLNLMLNSHLGAYLLIRFALPQFPDLAVRVLSPLGALAIMTSIYTAVLAIAAHRPRRILALLCTSQASFILAGLENRNVEGITGALLVWWVVAFATTLLLAVYGALEARSSEVASPVGFLGYGVHAPRLAVSFAVGALALVGLPGTLGFAAEELLFHGSLESHPQLGAALPLATALNAFTALRLFATLFLGKRAIHVPWIVDARPGERWALAVPMVLLVAGGIAPGMFVALRAPAADWIAGMLAGR